MPGISHRVDSVATRDDLAAFVDALRADLIANPDAWDNSSLELYLEALAGWISDSPGFFQNRGEPVPDQPSWRNVAQMLVAARSYE